MQVLEYGGIIQSSEGWEGEVLVAFPYDLERAF